MKILLGKVAAVTGTASGIGRATAIALAKEGCDVAISDVNVEELENTRKAIEAIGAKVYSSVLDVSDKEAMYQWADDVAKHFGKVNIIVNNAGVALGARIEEMKYEDFDWLMGINFYGMIYGTKAFLPHLRKAEEGHIVNISSVSGMAAFPALSAYTCSKFGIRGFTETLRLELDMDDGTVSATSVHPAGIKTNIASDARMDSDMQKEMNIDQKEAGEKFKKMVFTTPEKAASKIIAGIKKKKHRVLIGPDAYLIDWMIRLFPVGHRKLVAFVLKKGEQARLKKQAVTS